MKSENGPISDFKNPGFRSHKTWPLSSGPVFGLQKNLNASLYKPSALSIHPGEKCQNVVFLWRYVCFVSFRFLFVLSFAFNEAARPLPFVQSFIDMLAPRQPHALVVVVVVVVFTLKAVPVSTQYFLTSVLVQLTRTPSVVTG